MTVTLAEEIVLLALEDDTGVVREARATGLAAAGGIMLDLVLAGRIAVDEQHVVLVDAAPTGDPLLDGRLAKIPGQIGGRGKRHLSFWLVGERDKIVAPVIKRLCERGVIAEKKHRTLGVFPVRRYPEADGRVEDELRERLEAVVLHGAEPDARTAGLVALIHGVGLHELAFPGHRRKDLEPLLEDVAEGEWAGERVRAAVRDMRTVSAAAALATGAAIL